MREQVEGGGGKRPSSTYIPSHSAVVVPPIELLLVGQVTAEHAQHVLILGCKCPSFHSLHSEKFPIILYSTVHNIHNDPAML